MEYPSPVGWERTEITAVIRLYSLNEQKGRLKPLNPFSDGLQTSKNQPENTTAMKPYSANPNLTEPRWLRVLLTAVALGFLLLMLVVPLVAVFYEALKGGWDLYLQSITDPEAWAAIKLTLKIGRAHV